jgi:hypothetical protein
MLLSLYCFTLKFVFKYNCYSINIVVILIVQQKKVKEINDLYSHTLPDFDKTHSSVNLLKIGIQILNSQLQF